MSERAGDRPTLLAEAETGPLLFGHRGYSGAAPENTLAAFQLLLERGVPGVELDVHLSRDGRLVVFHDDNLERITGRNARVEETSAAEIRALDAGSWFAPSFRGERVPFLEEVFELLGDRVYYDIELKWGLKHSNGLERRVLERLRERGLEERCLVSSFNPFLIRNLRRLAPRLAVAHIYASHPAAPFLLRRGEARLLIPTPFIKPRHDQIRHVNSWVYRRLLRSQILAWTVDSPEEARRLLRLGVRGFISNHPGRLGLGLPAA